MANNGSAVLRLAERPVKEARYQVQQAVLKRTRALQKAQERLEEAGLSIDRFIERDEDGLPTGHTMAMVDTDAYEKAQRKE